MTKREVGQRGVEDFLENPEVGMCNNNSVVLCYVHRCIGHMTSLFIFIDVSTETYLQ